MTSLTSIARDIFLQTLGELDVKVLIEQRLKVVGNRIAVNNQLYDLNKYDKVILIGFGKASAAMGKCVESLLKDRLSEGLLVSNFDPDLNLKSQLIVAGHPLPDEKSLKAGAEILRLVQSSGETSLIIFLISGGGSALVEQPISSSIKVDDLRALNKVLVNCGASIKEINTVRRHLSRIKGGGLGYEARRSDKIALYLSDVNTGDLESIASGPLIPNSSDPTEFKQVIDRYELRGKLPASILRVIDAGTLNNIPDDWGPAAKSEHILLADNRHALHVARRVAEGFGFYVELDLTEEGNYRDVADSLIMRIRELQSLYPRKRVCLISGGEVSCRVTGDGIGGRNQEFVLYSATRLSKLDKGAMVAVLSCGTDGIDGNSTAAGAVASQQTITDAVATGIDPFIFLEANDSNTFFRKLGGLVVTGPTGNNLRDLRILVSEPRS